MSLIRVDITLFVDESNKAELEDLMTRVRTLNAKLRDPGLTEEQSKAVLHRCYHDEDPPRPCESLDTFEKARQTRG